MLKPVALDFSSIISLFYPHHCLSCDSDVLPEDEELCSKCFDGLPFTGFENIKGNPVEKMFWGRVELYKAFSVFYFNKGLVFQSLIHKLKYKHSTETGIYLGRLMALAVERSGEEYDCIVPMPLHKKKENKRGFNQCHFIGEGLAEKTGIALEEGSVIRIKNTESQTRKNRVERWSNVANAFEVHDNGRLNNKHILLIDDVITTGASVEACARELLQIEGVKITVASLAMAD